MKGQMDGGDFVEIFFRGTIIFLRLPGYESRIISRYEQRFGEIKNKIKIFCGLPKIIYTILYIYFG